MTENMVTIKSDNGEFTLEDWQVEAAYRHQEMFYTIMDAKKQVEDVLGENTSVEVDEDDYTALADIFLHNIDCNQDDNSRWEQIIIEYFGLYWA
ncbi:hypothetical protein EOM57_05180 [Candidatus Saccharibacteria bacterium]|nr:hypothetical protein [Candidatus Saccharibacteria bacterium]